MAKGGSSLEIGFDVSELSRSLSKLTENITKAADVAVKNAAHSLLADSTPYVPVLTGALKDSGEVVRNGPGDYILSWSAKSSSGFDYSQRQYNEVFQHVDGIFAARWVDRAQEANPGKYVGEIARVLSLAIARSGV